MGNVFFSIIMPVYNSAEWLPDSIGSIVAQNYQHWEFICINDGSEDESLDILQKYASKDKRIKIIDRPNAGASVARNVGLDVANGDYIIFLDSDDYFDINTLQILNEAINKTSADMIFVGLREVITSSHFTSSIDKEMAEIISPSNSSLAGILSQASDYPTDKIYKNDIIKHANLRFDPLLTISEDFHFWYRFAMLSDNIIKLNNRIYNHRITPNSLSSRFIARWQSCSLEEVKKNLQLYWHLAELCVEIPNSQKKYIYQRELLMRASVHYVTTKKKLFFKLKGKRCREAIQALRFPYHLLTQGMPIREILRAINKATKAVFHMFKSSLKFHINRFNHKRT